VGAGPAGGEGPRGLTLLYAAACRLCEHGRRRLEQRPAYVVFACLELTSPEARARYGALPRRGGGLVVVGDRGEVWAGRSAYLVTLWALRGERERAYRERDASAQHAAPWLLGRGRVRALWFDHRPCAGLQAGPAVVPAGPYR
jgi:hypothetical protein